MNSRIDKVSAICCICLFAPVLYTHAFLSCHKLHQHQNIQVLPNTFQIIMIARFVLAMASWWRAKVVDPLLQILRRGTEPKKLALSAALGITLGVFPICGVTVFLCGFAIAVLGSTCHAPTVMLANFVATPIELSLMVPFLRFGEYITGWPHFPLTSDAFKKVLTGQASKGVLQSIFCALIGWLVASPLIIGGLYMLSLPCFKILVRKFAAAQSPQKSTSSISSPKMPLSSNSDVRLKVDASHHAE